MDTQRLRFKGINGVEFPEWKKTSIEDLFEVSAGGDLDKDHFSHFKDDKHVYPIYANALTNGGLFGYSTKYTVAEKSITVTGRGEVGHATARDGKYTPIVRLLVCKPKNNQNTKFFEEAINRTNIVIESTGVPQLTVPQLKRIILPVPSLPEQQKIADFLSTYDEKIRLQRERVETLERRKKGLLQKIFSQEIRFKANDGSEFPEWVKKKLEDVVDFLDNQRKPITASNRKKGMYPYYGASGIVDYINAYLFTEELVLLSEDGANIIDRNYPVSFIASGKYWVNNHAHVLRCKSGNINKFISEQLEMFDYSSFNTGTAQPKLNKKTCRKLVLRIPVTSEQQKIADFLTAIDDQISIERERLSTMETIKKSLLQGLFC